MKHTAKTSRLIACVCLMIAGVAAAASAQKSVTVTGIPGNFRGKIAMLALAPPANPGDYAAYSLVTISGESTQFPLSDWKTDRPWNGAGNFLLTLRLYDNAQAAGKDQFIYSGLTGAPVNVRQAATAVQWGAFAAAAAAETAQKSITITGIPGSQRGRIAMLGLSPPNSDEYTAYSLVAINGAQVKFPLMDFTTDKPWGGSGDFSFDLLIYDNAQAAQNSQYRLHARISALTTVNDPDTTVQWSRFVAVTAQTAPRPQGGAQAAASGTPAAAASSGAATILITAGSDPNVRLEMTGGTVRNTSGAAAGNAIRNNSKGTMSITGGTVSAPGGNAINNAGGSALATAGARIDGKVVP